MATTAKKLEWQTIGGTLEIPDKWFVCECNFDVDEPYIEISNQECNKTKKLLIPKALAYYLSTHHCGSWHMREVIRDGAKREIQNAIKRALGMNNE